MQKMAVMSSDNELNERISLICEKFQKHFTPSFFASKEEALDYLKYDLPEVNLLNYSDTRINHDEVLKTMQGDPWLHYGGLIIVHKRSQQKEVLELTPSLNIIATIPRSEFVRDFFQPAENTHSKPPDTFSAGLAEISHEEYFRFPCYGQ